MHYNSSPIDSLSLLAENLGKPTENVSILHTFLGAYASKPSSGIGPLALYLLLDRHSQNPG